MRWTFSGYSDDILSVKVETERDGKQVVFEEEFYVYDAKTVLLKSDRDGVLEVNVRFTADGWVITPALNTGFDVHVDETHEDTVLTVDAPDGTMIFCPNGDSNDDDVIQNFRDFDF